MLPCIAHRASVSMSSSNKLSKAAIHATGRTTAGIFLSRNQAMQLETAAVPKLSSPATVVRVYQIGNKIMGFLGYSGVVVYVDRMNG